MSDTRTTRTYGNWTVPRSTGLGKLSLPVTIVAGVGLVISFLMYFVGPLAMLAMGALTVVFALAMSVRDRHQLTIVNRIGERLSYMWGRTSKEHLYRSGPLSRLPFGKHQLPGIAAQSKLYELQDSVRRPFALIHLPSTGHYSVVIGAQPDGAALVDQEQIDAWVAEWGGWLASLGDEPGLVAAAITIETAPDPGRAVENRVLSNITDDASPFAADVMRTIAVSFPEGTAKTTAYVTLTYAGRRIAPHAKRGEVDEVGAAIAGRLSGLTAGLEAAGGGWSAPLSAAELCEVVRVAYDPAVATLIDEHHADGSATGITWDEVGPAAHEARWSYYRHDSAYSMTWTMTQAPRGVVREQVLGRLLEPNPRIPRKRVTVHYRPVDPGDAADAIEREVNDAASAIASAKPTAAQLARFRAASGTAEAEAAGAGLVLFGMSVSATVLSEDELRDLPAIVEGLGKTARIRLRPAYGAQDSAFAATLPLGIVPVKHMRIPAELRGA